MGKSRKNSRGLPDWLRPEQIDTVIVAFPDMYGRLMGKRLTYEHFVHHCLEGEIHACNYLLSVDLEMKVLEGFEVANWEKGFGDFSLKADAGTLRMLPWQPGTALVLGNIFHEDGRPVEEAPRRVLARQIERLARGKRHPRLGSELELYLYDQSYRSAREADYRDLRFSSDYSIDYHILQPGRDESVLRRIRNQMSEAGVPVECSKGETGRGQHEVNLAYAPALEMADRHTIYKLGARDIAAQQGKAITFMAKPHLLEAGNGFHIHASLWDAAGKKNLFWDEKSRAPGRVFRQFLGGLLKYSRELSYFFAPTVNAYKRYQPGSWAPTAIVCGLDNRTCGFRLIGREESLRIENRMPGADANPYLAFAATLAAGLRGIEEELDADMDYRGDAYKDTRAARVPLRLEEAVELLQGSRLAREAFGSEVVDFYLHTARLEAEAYRQEVTDWERRRYFEQI